ncbi:Hypothetical protein, putative [Bodo saltans]|uniref:Uncharacterized protein n=1 Tax=Bodo saltans TaxID=75058 RepID=A0A0S4KPD0_BODSA|nr:Hypothetical protein, putative [Bodo saltans]|eukprot:CUI15492.1 Hypothetical protein, putative [Bodo saltans]
MSSPNSGFQAFVPDPTPWGGSTRTSMPTSTIILSKRTVAHLSFDRDQGLGYRRSEQQQQQSQKSTTVAAQGSDYDEERIHMLRLSPIAPTPLKFSELCSWRCEGLGKVSGCMLLPLAPHEGGQDDL